ncbi:MAG: M42 family metallopeptidase [Clostridiales bacterium]|nr:M42 family metallopeptidase [Clostridiales bacterium]
MVLKELSLLPGVSGDEGAVRSYILDACRPYADELRVDRMGNVIAFRRARLPGGGKHALLVAHMDEVGLIATAIRDDGLISYEPIGGIDPRVLVSKRVFIGEKKVPGVIGAKAIHLQSREELQKMLPHDQLYVDVGASDRASAEKLVSLGDYMHFDSDFIEFGEGLVKGRALDDRVGCRAALMALRGDYPCDLTCAFTVQEEVGTRGATAVGAVVGADCALILETTSANDLGDVDEHLRVCELGRGVALSFMDNAAIAHRGLLRALRALAERSQIPWQVKRFVSGGNDARAIQTSRGGVPTAVLSVPCRYIHSPSNVMSLRDADAQLALARAFLDSGAAI